MHRIRHGISEPAPLVNEAKPPRSCEGQEGKKAHQEDGGVKRSCGPRTSCGARRSYGAKRQAISMIPLRIVITKNKNRNYQSKLVVDVCGSVCSQDRTLHGRYFTGSPMSEPRYGGSRQAVAVVDTVWCLHPKAGPVYQCGRGRIADGSFVIDPCRNLTGKEPDERRRPPPRHSLLEQGSHPHPGPPREDTDVGDEDASFDPNTFLFLGADPAEYGL